MLRKVFLGITLSLSLVLSAQVALSADPVDATKAAASVVEKMLVELSASTAEGSLVTLTSAQVANLEKFAFLASAANIKNAQNLLNTISTIKANNNKVVLSQLKAAFDIVNNAILSSNGSADTVIVNTTKTFDDIVRDNSELANYECNDPVSCPIIENNFTKLMNVAYTVEDSVATADAQDALTKLLTKHSDVYANMTNNGYTFTADTITANPEVYNGVSVRTTNKALNRYASEDTLRPEVRECIITAGGKI